MGKVRREPTHIFVYGSLRPDDDSGQAWTKRWVEGLEARPASIACARLWHGDNGAQITLDGTPENTVTGYAMGLRNTTTIPAKRLWAKKLKEADDIAGYDPTSRALSSFFRRDRCTVTTADGAVPAFVFHNVGCRKKDRIPSGDWLKRRRADESSTLFADATEGEPPPKPAVEVGDVFYDSDDPGTPLCIARIEGKFVYASNSREAWDAAYVKKRIRRGGASTSSACAGEEV